MIMAGQTKTQNRKELDRSPSYVCCCCPCCAVSRSTATHTRYTLLLLVTFIICLVALVPNIRAKLDHVLPFCRTHFGTQICNNITGYSAVYRVSFGMGLFFLLLSVLLMGVRTVDDQRAQLHYGYWVVKALLALGFIVCSMFVPGLNANFDRVWMYFGLAGSFLFILVQLVLLIDFSYSLSSNMDGSSTSGNGTGTCWNVLLRLCTAALYGVSLTAVASFYIIFTNRKKKKCFSNTFFISFILFHCAVVSIVSVIPRVQRVQPATGLLQTAVVTTYTMYITWTALSHEPDEWCNPRGYLISGYNETSRPTLQSILASVIGFCTLVYAGSRPVNSSSRWRKWFSCFGSDNFTSTDSSQKTDNPSKEESTYNYSFFHFVMFLATLYFMMALTNWYSPYQGSQGVKLTRAWPAVWVKMGSSSACLWLYTWSLLAPLTRELIDKDVDKTHEKKETFELKQTRLLHKEDNGNFASPKAFSSPKVVAETKQEYRSQVGEILQNGENNTRNKSCNNNEVNLQSNCFPDNKNTTDLGMKQQPLSEADKEMFRLQEKILKIQSKIAKLQNKVAVLQGLDV